MSRKNKAFVVKIVSICLVLAFLVPINASAASENGISPYASNYLDSYNAYVYPAGGGKIQVYFSVTADTYMDDIGALSIQIYESTNGSDFSWVETFNHSSTSGMLAHDRYTYTSHVDYQGVAGRYYKAYICIWAGNDDDGDSRYLWTSYKKAT